MILFLSLVAAVGFLLATFLVDTTAGRSIALRHLSVVVAAGILLGVALADLVPETFELLDATSAALWIGAGFLVLFLVEEFTSGHTHHHEPHEPGAHAHAHSHAHAHASEDEACVPYHAVLPFLVGLGLHNFVDGVVIGASHQVSEAAGGGVALGILIHQLPVGLSFAAVLLASGMVHRRMRRNAALVAGLIPLGALVVLIAPDLGDGTLGALIGVAAGAILYIATGHLLPEAHSEERRPGVAAAFVIALVGSILLISALHAESHGGHDEDHGSETHEDEDHDAEEEHP